MKGCRNKPHNPSDPHWFNLFYVQSVCFIVLQSKEPKPSLELNSHSHSIKLTSKVDLPTIKADFVYSESHNKTHCCLIPSYNTPFSIHMSTLIQATMTHNVLPSKHCLLTEHAMILGCGLTFLFQKMSGITGPQYSKKLVQYASV